MPSKLVYVSEQHHGSSAAIDILSPKQLDKLLEEGFDVIKRDTRKVAHPKTKKQVMVDYLELAKKAPERGVSVTRPVREAALAEVDEMGLPLRSSGRGLSVSDNGSYLGGGSEFRELMGATGVDVRAGATGAAAYGMGVDCAKTQGLAEDCPFDPGTLPHQEWHKGFAAGGGNMPVPADESALKEAYDLGAAATKGPPDLVVSCPYPPRSDLYKRWLKGFKEAGGTVE